MVATPHTLDVERFARIWMMASHVPHDGGDNAHEREVARRMAEGMATRAGMSLNMAVKLASMRTGRSFTPPPPKRPNFPLHALEISLRDAGLDIMAERITVTEHVLDRIAKTIPRPSTIRQALAELRTWDNLETERQKVERKYALPGAAVLRRNFVEQFAATDRATTTADSLARAKWLHDKLADGIQGDFDEVAAMSVADDLRRMANRLEAVTRKAWDVPPTNFHKAATNRVTNAEKRAAVASILDGVGGETLSLREVAERAGVSHETVRAVKRQRKGR